MSDLGRPGARLDASPFAHTACWPHPHVWRQDRRRGARCTGVNHQGRMDEPTVPSPPPLWANETPSGGRVRRDRRGFLRRPILHCVSLGCPVPAPTIHTERVASSMQYRTRPPLVTSYCHWSSVLPSNDPGAEAALQSVLPAGVVRLTRIGRQRISRLGNVAWGLPAQFLPALCRSVVGEQDQPFVRSPGPQRRLVALRLGPGHSGRARDGHTQRLVDTHGRGTIGPSPRGAPPIAEEISERLPGAERLAHLSRLPGLRREQNWSAVGNARVHGHAWVSTTLTWSGCSCSTRAPRSAHRSRTTSSVVGDGAGPRRGLAASVDRHLAIPIKSIAHLAGTTGQVRPLETGLGHRRHEATLRIPTRKLSDFSDHSLKGRIGADRFGVH